MYLGGKTMINKIKISDQTKKKKIKFFDYFDSEGDSGLLPHIYLCGNKSLKVEGCKSIIEYTNTFIKLNLGKGCLTINGNCMQISKLEGNDVEICGEIVSVEFC